jgi:hypothetical protein
VSKLKGGKNPAEEGKEGEMICSKIEYCKDKKKMYCTHNGKHKENSWCSRIMECREVPCIPYVGKVEKCPEQFVCSHCGRDKRIRNPSGYCDHLYYPDSCKICQRMETKEPGVEKEPKVGEVDLIRQYLDRYFCENCNTAGGCKVDCPNYGKAYDKLKSLIDSSRESAKREAVKDFARKLLKNSIQVNSQEKYEYVSVDTIKTLAGLE